MTMLDFTNDVLYNVEGTKHWTPDPDITPEQLLEMREEVLERIIVARVGLLLRHPFFGNMATRLRILSADDWCPTAAVDGRNLYFNTQFFNKMNNKEIEFVIAHEILHCVFDHLGRRLDRDAKLYNIAADFIVNNLLVRIALVQSLTSLIASKILNTMVGHLKKYMMTFTKQQNKTAKNI